jgi:acetate kinase
MNVLVMNPGGNSLKVELISCSPGQQFAFEGSKLLSLTVEGIGKKPCLSVSRGKEVTHSEEIEAKDYGAAAANILSWLQEEKHIGRSDKKNRTLIEAEGKLSTASSALEALVVVTEEGLQIAHECSQALARVSPSLHQSSATL